MVFICNNLQLPIENLKSQERKKVPVLLLVLLPLVIVLIIFALYYFIRKKQKKTEKTIENQLENKEKNEVKNEIKSDSYKLTEIEKMQLEQVRLIDSLKKTKSAKEKKKIYNKYLESLNLFDLQNIFNTKIFYKTNIQNSICNIMAIIVKQYLIFDVIKSDNDYSGLIEEFNIKAKEKYIDAKDIIDKSNFIVENQAKINTLVDKVNLYIEQILHFSKNFNDKNNFLLKKEELLTNIKNFANNIFQIWKVIYYADDEWIKERIKRENKTIVYISGRSKENEENIILEISKGNINSQFLELFLCSEEKYKEELYFLDVNDTIKLYFDKHTMNFLEKSFEEKVKDLNILFINAVIKYILPPNNICFYSHWQLIDKAVEINLEIENCSIQEKLALWYKQEIQDQQNKFFQYTVDEIEKIQQKQIELINCFDNIQSEEKQRELLKNANLLDLSILFTDKGNLYYSYSNYLGEIIESILQQYLSHTVEKEMQLGELIEKNEKFHIIAEDIIEETSLNTKTKTEVNTLVNKVNSYIIKILNILDKLNNENDFVLGKKQLLLEIKKFASKIFKIQKIINNNKSELIKKINSANKKIITNKEKINSHFPKKNTYKSLKSNISLKQKKHEINEKEIYEIKIDDNMSIYFSEFGIEFLKRFILMNKTKENEEEKINLFFPKFFSEIINHAFISKNFCYYNDWPIISSINTLDEKTMNCYAQSDLASLCNNMINEYFSSWQKSYIISNNIQ